MQLSTPNMPALKEKKEEEKNKEDTTYKVLDSEEVTLLKVVDKKLDLSTLLVLRYESF